MESFFAILKKELVHHEHDRTHAEARHSLFEYIEVFYNRQRSHSALSYLSPAQFAEALEPLSRAHEAWGSPKFTLAQPHGHRQGVIRTRST